jgi:hypothetical protein
VRLLGPRASLPDVPGLPPGPLTGRQEVCSARCRAARSRQRRVEAQRERDAAIRDLLEAALKTLQEGVP